MNRAVILLSVILLLGAAGVGALFYRAQQEKTTVRVLRLPHTMNADHPVHLAMVYMADRVKERSKGKLIIQIYPNGLLGDGSQIKELMQLGAVDIGKFSACDFEDNIPEMAAFCLPYLFRDAGHYWRVLNSPLGAKILDAGYDTRARLKGLCFYDAGARSFYGKKPLDTFEALRHQKVRVMVSALMVAGVEALGASPTSMAWGELYTALQTGTVDAAENNIPSFYTSKHYEVCRYFSQTEHFRTPDVLAMSRRVWDDLSLEERAILEEAVAASVTYQRKLWDELSVTYMNAMKAAGVTFVPANQAALQAHVEPFYATLREKAESDSRMRRIMETADAIRAMP